MQSANGVIVSIPSCKVGNPVHKIDVPYKVVLNVRFLW